MLVVTRRPGQSVLIGPEIEVFVLEVTGSQVRVGINAPHRIRVLRRELLTQVEAENRRAAQNTAPTPQTMQDVRGKLKPSSESG
jgi:carbon storage regulator